MTSENETQANPVKAPAQPPKKSGWRWLKRVLWIPVLSVLLLVSALAWIIGTDTGTRWSLDTAQQYVPALTIESPGGSFWRGISASTIAWQQDDTSILITELDTQWRLSCLIERLVCIDKIAVTAIDVQLPASAEEPAADESKEPIVLPAIQLPVDIDLSSLTIDSVKLTLGEGEEPLSINAIEFSASSRENNVTLSTLSLAYQQYRAALNGNISLADDYPVNLTLAASATPLIDEHDQALNLRFSGSLENLVINGDTSGLAELRLAATLQPLDQALPYSATINWDEITWPPQALPKQIISQAGEITATGDLQRYAVTVKNSVRGDGIPASTIRLEGDGDFNQFDLASLLIETLGGQINVNGKVGWQGDIVWDANLTFDKLDPSQQWPDLSGDLNGGFTTKGQVKADAISATLDDVAVDGRLLDYPLSLRASAEHAIDQTILLKSLVLDIDDNTAGVPKTRLSISGQGDYTQFNASTIKVETLDGEVNGETRVIWSDPAFPGRLQWLTDLLLSNINPGKQWPDFPGQINGKLIADGTAKGDTWALTVTQADIIGQIRDYPLTLNTNLKRATDGQLTVDRLILNSGDNQIQVSGSLSDQWALDGELLINQAEALLPTLSGTAAGKFTIRGEPDAPDIGLTLNAQSLAINDVSIEAIDIEATIAALGESSSELAVNATGIKTSAIELIDVDATLSGSRSDHQLALSTTGDIDTSMKLEGALDDAMNWLGALASADIESYEQAWSLQKPATIGWQNETQTIDIAAHCWEQDEAKFCLDEDASIADSGQVKFSMIDFSLKSLKTYFPKYSEFEGIVTADGDLKWQANQQPQANINLAVNDGGIILLADEANESLDLRYQSLSVNITADQENVIATLQLDSDNIGNASAKLQIDPTKQNRPISGTVSLEQLELATFKAFFPQLKILNGSFTATGNIDGDLAAPRYQGNADITDLNVASNDLPVSINDGFIRTQIYGTHADIDAGWLSGGALVTLIGDADWENLDAPVINLELEGDSIEVRQAPTVIARVSPSIKLSINGQDVKLNGRVDIPYARVTIQELPPEATQISKDVIVIVEEAESTKADQKLRINTRMVVSLGNDVRFEGFGLRADLAGDIGIKQEPGQILLLDGEVQIPQGIYKAYGQNLTIRRGRLLLVGPIDETAIDVDAVRVVDMVTAGLRVRGSIKSPKVTLFSSPQQTQENTLSYIVLGKPIGAKNGSEAGILAQAALALSIEGGRDIATSIAEQFGIQDFQIDTVGTGNESQVQLSGRLSPNLLLSYGVGVLTPVNTLKLRYNLTENFYVETTQSVESALDFFYTFDI